MLPTLSFPRLDGRGDRRRSSVNSLSMEPHPRPCVTRGDGSPFSFAGLKSLICVPSTGNFPSFHSSIRGRADRWRLRAGGLGLTRGLDQEVSMKKPRHEPGLIGGQGIGKSIKPKHQAKASSHPATAANLTSRDRQGVGIHLLTCSPFYTSRQR